MFRLKMVVALYPLSCFFPFVKKVLSCFSSAAIPAATSKARCTKAAPRHPWVLERQHARILARETWYTSRRRIDTPFVTARSRPDPRVSVHPPPTARRKPDCSFSRYVLVHRSSIRCVVMGMVTPGIHMIDLATHFVVESGTSESIEACKR